jgi:hypothetical protein
VQDLMRFDGIINGINNQKSISKTRVTSTSNSLSLFLPIQADPASQNIPARPVF